MNGILTDVVDVIDADDGVLTVDVFGADGLVAFGFDLYPSGKLVWSLGGGERSGTINTALPNKGASNPWSR